MHVLDTNTNTNTNKFIIRNKAHTCMRAGTNVKQVINMNVHYKTKKIIIIINPIRHNKTFKDEDT